MIYVTSQTACVRPQMAYALGDVQGSGSWYAVRWVRTGSWGLAYPSCSYGGRLGELVRMDHEDDHPCNRDGGDDGDDARVR